MDTLKHLKSIEGLDGLNGIDIGSARYKEYMKLTQGISGSPDSKVGREIERFGLKPGVAITLNPSPMPPLDSELKYANKSWFENRKV